MMDYCAGAFPEQSGGYSRKGFYSIDNIMFEFCIQTFFATFDAGKVFNTNFVP